MGKKGVSPDGNPAQRGMVRAGRVCIGLTVIPFKPIFPHIIRTDPKSIAIPISWEGAVRRLTFAPKHVHARLAAEVDAYVVPHHNSAQVWLCRQLLDLRTGDAVARIALLAAVSAGTLAAYVVTSDEGSAHQIESEVFDGVEMLAVNPLAIAITGVFSTNQAILPKYSAARRCIGSQVILDADEFEDRYGLDRPTSRAVLERYTRFLVDDVENRHPNKKIKLKQFLSIIARWCPSAAPSLIKQIWNSLLVPENWHEPGRHKQVDWAPTEPSF